MQRRLVVVCTVAASLAWLGCNDDHAAHDAGPGAPDAAASDAASDAPPAQIVGLDQRPANTTCQAFTAPPATGNPHFVSRFPKLAIDTPTGMFQRPGDNARWFVTQRGGKLVTFPNDPTATQADVKVALDLSAVTWTQWDCSMSGIAFPPDFETSKVAYIGYCYVGPDTQNHLQIRISQFATSDGGLTFDPASEQVMVALDHPSDAAHPDVGLHATDAMRFGSDGYLYMTFGDGGPQGKGGGTQSQDTTDLRGKMLRLDVSTFTQGLSKDFVAGRQRVAAAIPADNPFVGGGGNPAIWAYGFRNPWQWHFDRKDGSIWLGDVGNNTREEVDRQVVKGGNYGWSIYEGFLCTGDFPSECADPTLHMPLLDYEHGSTDQQGHAITGGLVYRGTGVPSLTGAYFFGDSTAGWIWDVPDVDDLVAGVVPAKVLIASGSPVSSFAEDQDGELYATILYPTGTYGAGTILALQQDPPTSTTPGAGPPALLSETGCFSPTDPTTPADGLIPYAPIATLFSDNATKRRWFALPDGATIGLDASGDFQFPAGSVLVKEFSVDGHRIETRFFVRQVADGRWAAYTYQWRADESDADLVGEDQTTEAVGSGSQVWTFPSRSQCFECHTNVAGTTLDLELDQLDQPLVYPETGRTANQLQTLWAAGILDVPATGTDITGLPTLAAIGDFSRTTEDRARSYLHANCAHCHQPNGPTFTPLDLRYTTPFASANLCNQLPTIDDLPAYISGTPLIFSPGAPESSVLYERVEQTDPGIRMPPIARSLTDLNGASAIAEWIANTVRCPAAQ